jgi:hypothetical protein
VYEWPSMGDERPPPGRVMGFVYLQLIVCIVSCPQPPPPPHTHTTHHNTPPPPNTQPIIAHCPSTNTHTHTTHHNIPQLSYYHYTRRNLLTSISSPLPFTTIRSSPPHPHPPPASHNDTRRDSALNPPPPSCRATKKISTL